MNCKLTLAAALLSAAFAANAAVSDFTVNGLKITSAQQEKVIQNYTSRGQARTPELEAAVKKDIIGRVSLIQEAEKAGLDKDPEVQNLIAGARSRILQDALIAKYLKEHPVTDADMKALYEKDKAAYGNTEYHVQHLVVKTEAEAKKALERIKSGEAFAKVASEVSIDAATKSRGGDFGWHAPVTLVKPLADSIKNMKAGQLIQKPVAIPAGYDVFQVKEVRPAKLFPSFEQAKPQLRRTAMMKKASEYAQSVAAKAVVK